MGGREVGWSLGRREKVGEEKREVESVGGDRAAISPVPSLLALSTNSAQSPSCIPNSTIATGHAQPRTRRPRRINPNYIRRARWLLSA